MGGSGSNETKSIKRERIKEEEQKQEQGIGSLRTPTGPSGREKKRARTYDLTGDD